MLIRANISRAMTIPVTIVLRPSWVRTISAAAMAASVAPETAIPTSACFRAGASLTPSPVAPTEYPRSRSVSTTKYWRKRGAKIIKGRSNDAKLEFAQIQTHLVLGEHGGKAISGKAHVSVGLPEIRRFLFGLRIQHRQVLRGKDLVTHV